MSELQEYQKRYIDLALKAKILSFDGAPYTLKSGRLSPYFFNAGLFNTGALIDAVASCYAAAIVQSGIEFDVLFGPAYKVRPSVPILVPVFVPVPVPVPIRDRDSDRDRAPFLLPQD